MATEVIWEFTRDNFGCDYVPVAHGQSNSVRPLVLMVKQRQRWWKKPFGKTDIKVVAGLGDYVVDGMKQDFTNLTNSKIVKGKDCVKKLEGYKAASYAVEASFRDANRVELQAEIHEDRGDLQLGKLKEEYYTDPDLREILSRAALDPIKMAPFENQNLLLITAVVYSERFELKGNRKHQMKLGVKVQPRFQSREPVRVVGQYSHVVVPPLLVTRRLSAPFLFKCCRVEYDKDRNRLKIRDGDFVGKTVKATDAYLHDSDKGDDCTEAVMLLGMEEDLLEDATRITRRDYGKIKIIEKLLLTVETKQQRRCLVYKYLQLFEQVLTTGQKTLLTTEQLTTGDCAFLRKLDVFATPNQFLLNLETLSDKEMQGYGILLKLLSELPDEKWEKLQNILTVSE